MNGDPRLRFTDVTDRSRLDASGYGMGAATGDIDNDGWIDLYVTFLGSNRLFRNNGDGTFADVTARSGTSASTPRWSTSATFFDYDRDGWLDLFVAGYVNFRADMKRGCFSAGSARDYCNPAVYAPVPDQLFHNERNGTFVDVSARAGLPRAAARGLGVLAADYNDDGWLDVYVANDGDANQLWINQHGSGRFTDEALLAGVAVNRMGQAQGSMGVDLGDVDGDGDEDLFVTNLDNEGNTLYLNLGKGLYEDRTTESGLFTIGFTGFGTRFLDYDHDGWLDLFIANGAVRHVSRQVQAGDPYPLKQRNQVFRNERRGRFTDVTDRAGSALTPLGVARGVAAGDLDNDGGVDVVVFNNSGPARVLLNDVAAAAAAARAAIGSASAPWIRGTGEMRCRRASSSSAAAAARRYGAFRLMAATAYRAIPAWCSGSTAISLRRRFACTGAGATSKSFVDSPSIAIGSSSAASRRGLRRTRWCDFARWA